MKYLLPLCLCFALGCTPDATPQEYRDVIAAEWALFSLDELPEPDNTEYDCPRCKDTGYITHGDGHRTPCPDCNSGDLPGARDGLIKGIKDIGPMIARGKVLLAWIEQVKRAADQQGEIVVKIQIPGHAALPAEGVTVSPAPQPVSIEVPVEAEVMPPPAKPATPVARCQDGQCLTSPRRGLFWRLRRP